MRFVCFSLGVDGMNELLSSAINSVDEVRNSLF